MYTYADLFIFINVTIISLECSIFFDFTEISWSGNIERNKDWFETKKSG